MGAIISGAAPGYTINEMVHVLTKSRAKFIFVDHDSAATAVKAAEVVGIDPSNVAMLDGEMPGYANLRDLHAFGSTRSLEDQSPKWSFAVGQTAVDACAMLCFSSGTTGLPKAVCQNWSYHCYSFPSLINKVMISHANIIVQ
jgi:4-coumarate--CoA ligase